MSYTIKKGQYENAEKLNVTIKPSKLKNKKIDVFKDDKKVASIGASGYKDYQTYIEERGKDYANVRRKLYRARHKGEDKKVGSAGYYAWKILW